MQVGSTAMTQAKLFYFFLFTFHIDNVHLFKYTNWCEYDSLKSWTMRVWNTAMTKAILLFMMMCTSYKCTKWQCEYHSQHVGFLSFLFLLWCIVRNSLNGYWTCKAHSMIHRLFFTIYYTTHTCSTTNLCGQKFVLLLQYPVIAFFTGNVQNLVAKCDWLNCVFS